MFPVTGDGVTEAAMNLNDPGKYDDLCTGVREVAKAEGTVLIILNGE